MAYKIQLFFEEGIQGWSESFYYNLTFNPEAAADKSKKLAAKRMKLCTDAVTCTGFRISNPEVNTRQALFSEETNNIAGQSTDTNTRDVGGVAMLIRCYSEDLDYSRSMWLRGLPDKYIDFDSSNKPILQDQFNTDFAGLKNYLLAGEGSGTGAAASMRVITKGGLNAVQPISNVVRHAGTGLALVTGSGLLTPSDGESVRLKKVKFSLPTMGIPNSIYKALVPAGLNLPEKSFLLDGVQYPADTGSVFSGGGTWQARTHSYIEIARIAVKRATIKKLGAPILQQRSRRRR